MNEMTQNSVPNPFVDPMAQTFEDLLLCVQKDSGLKGQRRRNITSSLRSLCKAIGKAPCQVPAHASYLRPLLNNLHPAQCNLSKSRISNVRSDTKFALRAYGSAAGRTYMAPFTEAWQRLWDLKVSCNLEYDRRSVSRLMHLCSAINIPPTDVDDCIAERLLEALKDDPLIPEPEKRWKKILKAWNKLANSVVDWPQTTLNVPTQNRTFTIPLDQFPESFQQDVQSAYDRWADTDILDDLGPDKPLAPGTLRKRMVQIRELASAMVLSGTDISEVTSLRQLVEVESAKAILRFFLERANGKTNSRIHGLATFLKTLAKHDICVHDGHLQQLQDLCRRLDPGSVGMTERNRDRLRPFEDRKNVQLILGLPSSTIAQVLREDRGLKKDAHKVQWALAVELLTMAPIRLKNLAGLDVDRHIVRTRSIDGEVHLVVPGEEVKNDEPLNHPLPKETVEILDLYLREFRPRLCAPENPWLFPGKSDEAAKSGHTLSQQVSKFIAKATGLKINIHLFRHLAAKLYLDQNPGQYENVRRHLGHRDIRTTVNAYAGMETAAASRHFDDTILRLRRSGAMEVS
jgi:integrase